MAVLALCASAVIVELFEMSELNCGTKTRAYMEARNVLEVHKTCACAWNGVEGSKKSTNMCMEWSRRNYHMVSNYNSLHNLQTTYR